MFRTLKCIPADPKALPVPVLEFKRAVWSLTGTSNHFQSSGEKLALKRMEVQLIGLKSDERSFKWPHEPQHFDLPP